MSVPNLFYDADTPILEVRHNSRHFEMFLDTGANDTSLYPLFGDALTAGEKAKVKKRHEKQGGVGGVIARQIEAIPRRPIDIAGKSVHLKNESLRSDPPKGDNLYRAGVIGMDALWGGFTLDFDA